MFAILSASGDLGGAIIPWAAGSLADRGSASDRILDAIRHAELTLTPDQAGLRSAFLIAALCPLAIGVIFHTLRYHERQPA